MRGRGSYRSHGPSSFIKHDRWFLIILNGPTATFMYRSNNNRTFYCSLIVYPNVPKHIGYFLGVNSGLICSLRKRSSLIHTLILVLLNYLTTIKWTVYVVMYLWLIQCRRLLLSKRRGTALWYMQWNCMRDFTIYSGLLGRLLHVFYDCKYIVSTAIVFY